MKLPPCPDWLPLEAQREWKRIAPQLNKMQLLTFVDKAGLAGYCLAWAQLKQAQEALGSELTYEYTNKNGSTNQITKPEVAIIHKCLEQIRAFCSEFGLTPSSRGRLKLPGDNDEESDPMEKIMKKIENNRN